MADLFISYSRKDKAFVRALHTALTAQGHTAWVDWEDIPLTADWQKEIYEAIQATDTFVFVISPDSVASEVCGQELGHAVRYNKRLVPVYHREVDLHTVNPELRAYNFVYLREEDDFDSTLRALNTVLDTDLEYVKYHTRLLIRAIEWDSKKRDDSYVLRGRDLREAEIWLASSAGKKPDPGELHLQYIAASRQAAIARQRITVGSLAVGIIIAIALTALAFYQSTVATDEAHNRATAQVIAQNEADSNATAQSVAQTQAAIALSEANSRATAQSVAVTQQNVAEQNAATALAAESTAQRSADEAQSQALAAAAQLALNENNTELAVALGLEANTVANPPPGAQRGLAEAAYTPAVRRAYVGHTAGQTLADISADGRTILSGGVDGEVFVWDAASGQISQRLQGAAAISALDLSPDGHRAVTGSCESADADSIDCSSELILWNVDNGTLIRRWTAHAGVTRGAAFSPDGKWVASGGYDEQTIIWDAESGAAIQRFQGNYGPVLSVAFTVNGDALLSGASVGMDMWDVKTGQVLRGFGQYVTGLTAVAPHPDGARVVAGSRTGELIMWSLDNAAEIRRFVGHAEQINSIAFTPGGAQMISSSGGGEGTDSSIILWDVETGVLLRRFEAPRAGSDLLPTQAVIRSLRFTPDGRILSASDDGQLRLWDVDNGAIIRRFSGHRLPVEMEALAYSPDGVYLASGSSKIILSNPMGEGDGEIYLWDVNTSQPIREFKGHTQSVTGLAFLPDGKRLLSASRDGTLILWDVASGNLIQQFEGQGSPIRQLVLSRDGHYALSRGEDGQVMLWDMQTLQAGVPFKGDNSILVLAISADGGRTATVAIDDDGVAQVYMRDTQTGSLIWGADVNTVLVTALAFSPDDQYLLAGSFDGSLLLLDAATGEQIGQPFVGHEGNQLQRINSIAFSPDGHYALSGSSDATMILWAFPEGRPLRRFRSGTDWVTAVAFSPDGHRAASADSDGKLVLWRIDTLNELIAWTYANRVVREPSCNERIQYRLQPACDEQGDYPTHTPYPSLTPSATFTPSPTLDLTQTTATPSPTPTATPTVTATFTATVTLTPTPTTAPATPIPFSDLQRLTAELNLPFTPLLPGTLPEGVYLFSVKSYVPVEADAPLVTGDMAFLIGLSTNPTYSRDNPDKVVAVTQTTTTFTTIHDWVDSTILAPVASYITFAGYEMAFLRQDSTSGTLIVLRDGLLIRFSYLGLDLDTLGAIIQSVLPPV